MTPLQKVVIVDEASMVIPVCLARSSL